MRNLWLFIVNNVHLLLFILLEVVAFLIITSYQPFPHSTLLTSANRVVAGVNEGCDGVVAYFVLNRDNEKLNNQIAQLQMQVQSLQNQLESTTEKTALSDSSYVYAHLSYRIIPARVIDVTTTHEHNYLTLNKGSLDGLAEGMGVIEGNRVVGIVSCVNDRFAQVVPLIHTSCNLSARIKTSGQIGFTSWRGFDALHVQLMEIGRHIPVENGDTVVTSGMTMTFPEGLQVGTIDKVHLSSGDNYYQIRVRLSTDYHNLRYVQVLDNTMKQHMDSLSHE